MCARATTIVAPWLRSPWRWRRGRHETRWMPSGAATDPCPMPSSRDAVDSVSGVMASVATVGPEIRGRRELQAQASTVTVTPSAMVTFPKKLVMSKPSCLEGSVVYYFSTITSLSRGAGLWHSFPSNRQRISGPNRAKGCLIAKSRRGRWRGKRRKPGPLGVGERVGDEKLVEVVRRLRATGSSLRAIASDLNRRGWLTPKGKAWHSQHVHNILRRTNHSSPPSPTQNGVEYYTPTEVIEAARAVLGRIDLDPCSCQAANRVVQATTYFTRNDDGLRQKWSGRVWVNPPGRRAGQKKSQARWWDCLVQHYMDGTVKAGIFLAFNLSLLAVGRSSPLPAQAFPFVVFHRPLRYTRPDGRRMTVPYSRSMVILVSRSRAMLRRFTREFGHFGVVTVPAVWADESRTVKRRESRRHSRRHPHRSTAGRLAEEKSKPYLDTDEAARVLRRTNEAVYALVKRGTLKIIEPLRAGKNRGWGFRLPRRLEGKPANDLYPTQINFSSSQQSIRTPAALFNCHSIPA